MGLLILFFVISIAFSFLCSIWEAVLLSVTPTYIRRLKEEGRPLGEQLAAYKADIDRPLSAILSLNTIAHTVGAIGVGAQAGALYGTKSVQLGPVSLSYEAIVATLMTLAILILSEIIPKTLGANNWRKLSGFTATSLRVILFLLAPLVWISQLITKSLKNEKNQSVLSRSDIHAIAKESERHGTLDKSESAIIRNMLKLDALVVRDIMTPRSVLLLGDANESISKFHENRQPLRFSRIPVFKEDKDHIVGIALKYDVLNALAEGRGEERMETLIREAQYVTDDLVLTKLFDLLVQNRIHLAVVVDQYGSLVGVVTMEDLFETILGVEITDESDNVEDMQRLARSQWEERAKRLGLISSDS